MGLFLIGRTYYARWRSPKTGRWVQQTTGCKVGDEKEARERWNALQAAVEAIAESRDAASVGAVTVRSYSHGWVKDRKALGIGEWKANESHLRVHILPVIGDMEIGKVRPRHLIRLFKAMRMKDPPPAPKTVWNIYSTAKALFRDAFKADLVLASPAVLDSHDLGPMEDADPEWRDTAVFTRAELERLISDPEVPEDRRVLYALEGLAGLRHGEAAALRWSDYEPEKEPLGLLSIWKSNEKLRTKTRRRRWMPVHPTLATILADWKLRGWPGAFGHQPGPEELVVPVMPKDPANNYGRGKWRKPGSMRTRHLSRAWLLTDLATLGLRHRRGHDLRRTMITLAQEDGADPDRLYRVTHNPKGRGSIVERYTSHQWAILCAEVAKLKVARSGGFDRV